MFRQTGLPYKLKLNHKGLTLFFLQKGGLIIIIIIIIIIIMVY